MSPAWRKIIGSLEILGGILGLLIGFGTVAGALGSVSTQPLLFVLLPILLAAFILSVTAGVLLLRSDPRGLHLSIYTQTLQVPVISSSLLVYSFFAGVQLAFTIGVKIGFRFNLGGSLELHFGQTGAPFLIGINVVAAFFLWKLLQAKQAARLTSGGAMPTERTHA